VGVSISCQSGTLSVVVKSLFLFSFLAYPRLPFSTFLPPFFPPPPNLIFCCVSLFRMVYASIRLGHYLVEVDGPKDLLEYILQVGSITYKYNHNKELKTAKFSRDGYAVSASLQSPITAADIIPLLNLLEASGWKYVTTVQHVTKLGDYHTESFLYFNKTQECGSINS
jgi:hypothetical protein